MLGFRLTMEDPSHSKHMSKPRLNQKHYVNHGAFICFAPAFAFRADPARLEAEKRGRKTVKARHLFSQILQARPEESSGGAKRSDEGCEFPTTRGANELGAGWASEIKRPVCVESL